MSIAGKNLGLALCGLVAAALAGCEMSTPSDLGMERNARTPTPMRAGTDVSELDAFETVANGLSGVWRSNGYGYLADLSGEEPAFFHLTDRVCLCFSDDEGSLFDVIDSALLLEDGSRLLLGASPEPHVYEFERIPELPQRCQTPPTSSYSDVFETFASYMSQHYAFFDLYGVDWAERVAGGRLDLAGVSGDAAMFDLLTSMLSGLDDGHLELAADIDGNERSFDPGEATPYLNAIAAGRVGGLTERAAKRAFDRAVWLDGVDRNILGGEGVSVGNDWIKYGLAAPGVGYIATFTSAGFASRDFSDPLGDLVLVEDAFNDALALFEAADVRTVIFDASLNHGGHDFISRAMAAHFAPAPVLAYSKHAGDADDPYRTDVMLAPSQGRRFTGEVFFVTSDITVSAAEILALSMRALPNVTLVGQPTRGAFSDILEKPLPNGWVLTVSNEVYADSDGIIWEGPGVPPEIILDIFPPDDPVAGHAAAIRTIIELADGEP